MLTADLVGCVASCVILVAASSHEWGLWLGTALLGLSMASVFPLVLSQPAVYGAQVCARDTGWLVVGGTAGEMVIPLVIGYLMTWTAPSALVWTSLATMLLLCCTRAAVPTFGRAAAAAQRAAVLDAAGGTPACAAATPAAAAAEAVAV